MSRPYRRYDKSHSEDDHYHSHHYMSDEQRAELRDIFAALAMQTLIKQDTSVKWVSEQSYKYADAMLEARNSSVSEKPID
ncbi:MAG: hypothetical protein EBS19_08440 [Spirochaetia bacterium]|nr:hypothetical protein [Spirochaetia bacterium]